MVEDDALIDMKARRQMPAEIRGPSQAQDDEVGFSALALHSERFLDPIALMGSLQPQAGDLRKIGWTVVRARGGEIEGLDL